MRPRWIVVTLETYGWFVAVMSLAGAGMLVALDPTNHPATWIAAIACSGISIVCVRRSLELGAERRRHRR